MVEKIKDIRLHLFLICRKSVKLPFLLCLVFCIKTKTFSQKAPAARVVNYNTDNGLPQNSGYALEFDNVGNLWMTTQGGVVCFDGVNFKQQFYSNPPQRFGNIFKFKGDSLWVMDIYLNAYAINSQVAELTKINGGYMQYWEKIGIHKSVREIEECLFPFGYLTDKNLNYYYWSPQTKEISCLNTGLIYAKTDTQPLLLTSGDSLIVITNNKNISVYSTSDRKIIPSVLQTSLSKSELQVFFDKAIFFVKEGNSFALFNNGFYKVFLQGNLVVVKQLLRDLPEIKDPKSCAYNKFSNTFAISSTVNGLYILQPAGFTTYHKTEADVPGKSFNSLTGIVQLLNGDYLDNLGVRYPISGGKPAIAIKDIWQLSLFQDREKNIWYQRESDKKVIKCTQQLQEIEKYDGFKGQYDRICCFSQGNQQGQYYIANSNGIYKLIENKGVELLHKLEGSELLIDRWVESIHVGNGDSILLLTKNGLYFLNNNFAGKKRQVYGTAEIDFRCSYLSKKGSLWLGSYGNGFFLLKDKEIINMPLDQSTNLKNVNAILEDDNGYLWLSTNNGLYQVKESDLEEYVKRPIAKIYYHFYNKSLGFRNNEFNGGPCSPAIKTKEGLFSFCNLDGIVQFNPLEIRPNLPNGFFSFGNIKVNGEPYLISQNKLTLSSDFNEITIDLIAPFWGLTQNLQLEYQVTEISDAWNIVGENKKIVLNRLPPGDYTLNVRRQAGFGKNNYDYVKLFIRIAPPFYKTAWFYSLAAVLALLGVYIFIKYRTLQHKKREDTLRTTVAEKTIVLRETNEKLLEKNRQNELMLSVFTHDIRGPVKYLYESLNVLEMAWDKFSSDKRLQIIGQVCSSSKSIHDFTSNFLNFLNLQNTQEVKFEKVKLKELCFKVMHFANKAENNLNEIILQNKIPSEIEVLTNPGLLLIILNNIIDNAVKYTAEGSIKLYATQQNNNLVEIVCEDTGSGMSEQKVDNIFDNIVLQNWKHELQNDSFKLGYLFIQKALPKIKGTLNIISVLGKGTKVTITIPGISV